MLVENFILFIVWVYKRKLLSILILKVNPDFVCHKVNRVVGAVTHFLKHAFGGGEFHSLFLNPIWVLVLRWVEVFEEDSINIDVGDSFFVLLVA